MSYAATSEKTVTVRLCNKRGLHARAASKFAKLAAKFEAKIHVTSVNDTCAETVEGDTIMELLMLGSAFGEDIIIAADGPAADEALRALTQLVESRFGENE